MTVLFDDFIDGDPKPQARPVAWAVRRNGKWSGQMGKDTEAACVPWRKVLGAILRAHVGMNPASPRDVPLTCELRFVFKRPGSHLKRNGGLRKSAPAQATSVRLGDLDNLAKSVLDELEGPLLENDAAIVEMLTLKRYAGPQERPGVRITLREWQDPAPRRPPPLGEGW